MATPRQRRADQTQPSPGVSDGPLPGASDGPDRSDDDTLILDTVVDVVLIEADRADVDETAVLGLDRFGLAVETAELLGDDLICDADDDVPSRNVHTARITSLSR